MSSTHKPLPMEQFRTIFAQAKRDEAEFRAERLRVEAERADAFLASIGADDEDTDFERHLVVAELEPVPEYAI